MPTVAIAVSVTLGSIALITIAAAWLIVRRRRAKAAGVDSQPHELKDTFGTQPEADGNALYELGDGTQVPELKDTFGVHPEADSIAIHEMSSEQGVETGPKAPM